MMKQIMGMIKDKLVEGIFIKLLHLTIITACIGGMREPPIVAITCPAPASFMLFPVLRNDIPKIVGYIKDMKALTKIRQ